MAGTCVKANHVRDWAAREEVELADLEPLLGLDPAVERTGDQLSLFTRLTGACEAGPPPRPGGTLPGPSAAVSSGRRAAPDLSAMGVAP